MSHYRPYISTQADLRGNFWAQHPQFARRGRTRQNDYPAEIRMAWCDYVEHMRRNGDISENLAQKATL